MRADEGGKGKNKRGVKKMLRQKVKMMCQFCGKDGHKS